jgi:hypothetical protein
LTAVDVAVATTIGRLSAASAKGDKSPIVLQTKGLAKLSPQPTAARADEQDAAAKLAQALASAGIDAQVTKAQSAKAIAQVLSTLAKRGISTAKLQKLAGSVLVPSAGDFITILSGGKVKPPAPSPKGSSPTSTARPAINSVQFSGSPDNPTIVVRGTNLGKLPVPSPAGHPAGQNGCPVVAGDNGYDYGTSLYIVGVSKAFAGGRYRPTLNETDCIDLVVTKFTQTEVDFHFGPFYAKYHSQFSLDPGDAVRIVINGASLDVHVKYGATATG